VKESVKRKVTALLLIVAAAFMLVGNVLAADNETSETWQVAVGKETASTALDSMFPKVIYIHEGDKVVFTNGAKTTPHTVTFLGATTTPLSPQDPAHAIPTVASGASWDGKALLNSGIMLPAKSYDVAFTASGAYPYYCVLHPMMQGTVVVIPKGQPIPSKVEQAAAAKALESELVLQAQLLDGSQAAAFAANKDGSLTYKVAMGSGHSTLSHNKMNPEVLVVSAGDSVEWTNASPYEPHFVTFNKPADLNFFTERGEFNPKFMAPAGGKEFNGTGFTNSGIVPPGLNYSLKFTKTGTYTYECYLHAGSKMTGTVVVVAKNAVKLQVNGKAIADSAGAQWVNGDLNVSVTAFAKALGGKAVVDTKGKIIAITVGNGMKAEKAKKGYALTVLVNGKALQTAGYSVKGTAYASAEEIVRALSGSYSWNEQTKTFKVTIGAAAASTAHNH
jgi:plastocyanin